MPPVRGGVDEHRAGWQGNRCKILPAHMPFLILHAARSGNPQEMLESKFGIDQTTISRYLSLALTLLTNPRTMPTIVAIADEIAETPGDEVVEAIGHVINCDVTEFEIEAPGDGDSNDDAFSGKAQTTTAKAVFMCGQAGLFLAMGELMEGRKHDTAALRETLPFLCDVTRSLEDPATPEDKRLTLNLDRGVRAATGSGPAPTSGSPARRPRDRRRSRTRIARTTTASTRRGQS